jgi:hypothetical protein
MLASTVLVGETVTNSGRNTSHSAENYSNNLKTPTRIEEISVLIIYWMNVHPKI